MDFNLFHALIETLLKNPASISIILAISIAAVVMEKWQAFPSKLILLSTVFLGMVLFPLLSPWDRSLEIYPYPQVMLALNGTVIGFIAWLVHAALIRRLIKRFHVNGEGADPATPPPPAPPEPPKPPTPPNL